MKAWRKTAALVGPTLASILVCIAPATAQVGEKKVSIGQVPPAVRTAVRAQIGSGELVDIGVYQHDGETVYDIEMVVEGVEYDVLFAGDGTVLRRTYAGAVEEGTRKKAGAARPSGDFQSRFHLEERELGPTGRNRFLILEPGYRLVLAGREGDHTIELVVTVLAETRRIEGIETRVVEERESVDGGLVEISRNFFAIDNRTGSVFYFGEEVDLYEDGEIVGHEGAWLHGKDGARAGMMMPGEPLPGASYHQEVAPGIAMDRARIPTLDATLDTPAGTLEHCLRVQEENPLDDEKEFKIHAPGIGLIQDENLLLVEHGFVDR